MRPRNIEEEASRTREALRQTQIVMATAETIAAFWTTPTARILEARLTAEVQAWEKVGSWGPLDAEAIRDQGKAMRSREWLDYFKGAEESAKHHRAEAERLAKLLETAADQGRISRA